MWLCVDDCEKVVSDAWSLGLGPNHTESLLGNFESCRLGFITWSKTSFGHIRKKVRYLEKRIVQLQELPVTWDIAADIRECTSEIERCLAQEEVVLDILNRQSLDASLNLTHIVLIPKCDEPETVSQFRPISLCNVIFKIASKCIANRIKPFMNSIISATQSAFIPGRLITDNIIVAYELNHFLKAKKGGQKGFAAIKLDMSKAYYRVEWPFLESMLCRSLRQGDPLSPYLFLFCSETLSDLFMEAQRSGSIRGVKIAKNAPCISHLLFVDDILIFCDASLGAMQDVANLLTKYEAVSSQKVNLEKSSMVLSRNVNAIDKDSLANSLRVRVI
ncbi:UNVERIFIED_CONTAM: putative mitochondrial protein [Sesamum radiatum]|uniref:Mitochondrial protein n=1 Tax=Sesamum radiatum TaxID=300843 RepID=A0AAW2R2P8_SESRA